MRRHTSALIAGAGALAGLLVLLGVLQLRWLDQVVENLTAQKRGVLRRQATAFATDLDRELTRVFMWFEPDFGPGADPQPALAARWRSFRQAGRHVGLVRELWLYRRARGDEPARFFRLDPESAAWREGAWPAGSEGVRAELERGLTRFGLVRAELFSGGPLLAVPRFGPGPRGGGPGTAAIGAGPGPGGGPSDPGGGPFVPGGPPPAGETVFVALEATYLTAALLPALAEQHLDASRVGEPAVAALVDDAGKRLFAFPAPGSEVRAGEHEPVSVFGARPDLGGPGLLAGIDPPVRRGPGAPRREGDRGPRPRWEHTRREGGAPAPPDRDGPRRVIFMPPFGPEAERSGPGAWTLHVGYAAGPVDAVVTGLRRRNTALGFGILGVIAAAVGALILAVRRAQALAERQRQFIASVSHELRTPLAVIGAAAENLRDGTVEDDARVREYGEMIHGESKRLHAMVDDVLRLAAGKDVADTLHREAVDVRDVVDAAVDSFAPELRARGGRLERTPTEEVPPVLADPEALRQAVENVVGNAIKYGGEAPVVTVGVRAGANGDVEISVEDQGLGIPPGEQALIFEPFFRGSEVMSKQIRGTGLGLALVARVMRAHGGRVSVASTPGQGSRFVLSLPVGAAS